jgi:hypothetical protein
MRDFGRCLKSSTREYGSLKRRSVSEDVLFFFLNYSIRCGRMNEMTKNKTLGKGLFHLEGFAVFSIIGEGKTVKDVWDALECRSLSRDDVIALTRTWVKAGLLKRDEKTKVYWYSVRGVYVRKQLISIMRVVEGLD